MKIIERNKDETQLISTSLNFWVRWKSSQWFNLQSFLHGHRSNLSNHLSFISIRYLWMWRDTWLNVVPSSKGKPFRFGFQDTITFHISCWKTNKKFIFNLFSCRWHRFHCCHFYFSIQRHKIQFTFVIFKSFFSLSNGGGWVWNWRNERLKSDTRNSNKCEMRTELMLVVARYFWWHNIFLLICVH